MQMRRIKQKATSEKLVDLYVRSVERELSLSEPPRFFGESGRAFKGLSLFLGAVGPASVVLSEWASEQSSFLLVVDERPPPLDWLQDCDQLIDFVIVDADYLDDIEQTLDFCLQIRRRIISLPVILLSSELRGYDLTCENMLACDATLPFPVTKEIVSDYVEAALRQNYLLSGY